MKRSYHWTRGASMYTGGAFIGLAAGAVMGQWYLVLFAGTVLLAVALDALLAAARQPIIRIEVSPHRIPEDSEARITLHGERLSRQHSIEVRLGTGLRVETGSNIWHPRDRRETASLGVKARVRGPQAAGPAVARTWSLARLWAVDDEVAAAKTIEVVPRVEDASGVLMASRVVKPMQGRFSVNRPGQGFDFFTLRQYASGDTMRDVNWRASARGEELIVNQRQLETHSEVLLILDARVVSGAGTPGSTPLDRGCRLLLGLADEAIANRDTLRVAAYGTEVATVQGRQASKETLEHMLARLPARGHTPLLEAWQAVRTEMRSRGPIVLVSSGEADATAAEAVLDMTGRGHPVTVVSPVPEDTWPAMHAHREQARERVLDGMRDGGAMVVDWPLDRRPEAAAPDLSVVPA